jgi:hypothetical protein
MPRPQTATAKTSLNRSAGSGAPKTPQALALDDAPPMRQRRGLFFALLAIFFAWIAAVLIMYFTTVRPHGGRLEPLPPGTTNNRPTP